MCVIADSPQSQIQNQKIFYTGTNTKDSEFQTICDWLHQPPADHDGQKTSGRHKFCIDSRSQHWILN